MSKYTPFQLPKELYCPIDDVVNGVTIEIVKKYIKRHQNDLRRYKYLENMYKGFHSIYNIPEREDWVPDNRLAVNFPRHLVDTFLGFAYGIPIYKSHPDEKINEAIADFEKDNEITDHDHELFKKACINGHSWEYFYQDEQAKTKMTVFSPVELFCVYDDTLRHRSLFAVRYGYHEKSDGSQGDIYGEILTRETISYFEKDEIVNVIDNPYGLIPVVEYKLNDERIGLFENATQLIETYNKTLSEKANDVDAFAEAILEVIGPEISEEIMKNIRQKHFLNIYDTDDFSGMLAQFLQKPTADATQENLLNRLEDRIYEQSNVANITDDSFGSGQSGRALSYKLNAMSNMALDFDRKNEKSLRKRYKIFCSLKTNCSDPEAYKDIEIKTTRNLPQDMPTRLEEVQAAAQLEGMVSKKTQLSTIKDIVSDVDAELERMAEEEKERVSRLDDVMYGGGNNGENE